MAEVVNNADVVAVNVELSRALKRLEGVLASITDGLLVLDHEWRYSFVSAQSERILGIPAGDLIGQCVWDLFPHTQGTKFYECFHQAAKTGVAVHFEEFYPAPLNMWLECRAYPSDQGLSVYFHDVTARKAVEEELRLANERFELAIKGSSIVVFNQDLDLKYTWIFNPALGFDASQVLGRTDADLFERAEDAALIAAIKRSVIHSGKGRREDVTIQSKGAPISYHLTVEPLRSAAGAITGVTCAAVDVTSSRQAAEQLRRNHDSFYHLIASNPFGIYIIDADFSLRQISDGARKIFSNIESPIGQDFSRIIHTIWPSPFADEVIARFRHTLATGEPYFARDTVEQRRDKDATESYDWRIERLVLPDGRHGVVCYFYDLSERHQFEASLLAKDRELQSITDNVPDVIARFDRDLRFVYVNSMATRLTGIRDGLLLGRGIDDFNFPPELCTRWKHAISETFKSGSRSSMDFNFDTVIGTRSFNAHLVPEFGSDGAVQTVLVVTRDVTDAWHAAEELRRAKEIAESASAAKDHFLAVLSHELRTPLASVQLVISMWERRKAQLPDAFHSELAMIRRNVELECRLIDDMLDLNRIARNKLQLHVQRVDIAEEVAHAVRAVGGEAAAKGVTLTMAPGAPRCVVRGDAARLQQVLWNLLKNSVKFTPSGGSIFVRTFNRTPDFVCVEVRDTGLGIEPPYLKHIFNAFEQGGDFVTRHFGGLGLGLAISKAIAELHSGTLSASSPGSGQGSTFVLEIPLAGVEDPSVQMPGDATGTALAPLAPDAGSRILLVEDHIDTAQLLVMHLGSLGHEVKCAGSVADAIDTFKAHVFDLVVSDIGLPDGSGADVMKQVQSVRPTPGIALTGYGMEEDVKRGFDAGFSAYLTKPVNIEQLEVTIRRVLKVAQARAASAPRLRVDGSPVIPVTVTRSSVVPDQQTPRA